MHKVFYFEILSQLIKVYLICIVIGNFGFFLGISFIYIFLSLYRYLVYKFLGLEYVSFDKSLMGFRSRDQYTINMISCFDRNESSPLSFEPEKIKKAIISRLITQIPKLRSKIVYTLFNFYWKEFPIEEALSKIKLMTLPNKTYLEQYINSQVSKRIETYNNIPYEFNIIKYEDNSGGAVQMKFDHVVSDGLGFLSMVCFLADDFTPAFFPKILNIKYTYNFLTEIKDTVLFPIHIFLAIYVILFSSWEKTDFKIMYNFPHLGDSKLGISKWYDISEIKKLRTKYSVSFNDSVVGVLMLALPHSMDDKVSGLNVVIPCGYTKAPSKASDICLKNLAQGFLMYIPFIKSFKELPKLRKIIMRIFSTSVTSIPLILFKLVGEIFPLCVLNLISNYLIFKVDMLVSNCPGPDVKCKLCGWEMTDFYPVVSSGRMKGFVTIGSYNRKFRFVIAYDKSVKYDPKETVNQIDKIMQNIIDNKID